jgi:hypothetical protein
MNEAAMTTTVGMPQAPPAALDVVMNALDADASRLADLIDQLETRLAPLLAEDHPRPEEAPETPPGASPVVVGLAHVHNRLLAVAGRVGRLIGRLEVGS